MSLRAINHQEPLYKIVAATIGVNQAKAEVLALGSIHEVVKNSDMRERFMECLEISDVTERNREKSLTTHTYVYRTHQCLRDLCTAFRCH